MTKSPKPKCEVCGRAIRRDHTHVQITQERRRHQICHEREAEREQQCSAVTQIVGGVEHCQFFGTPAELANHDHRNRWGGLTERVWSTT
jgi:hypothetical protein